MPRNAARLNCAIYTRKSSEEGLEQEFNSLHAQREACEAYIQSQKHEGWKAIRTHYDDGEFSGGNMQRPGIQKLLEDIEAGRVQVAVVYKVDRLTRALSDFARIIEAFDEKGVSFVSITQQFNTTTSMGRLTLNVLLSFAQFEREVTGERIRDKIAASKKKGMWMGGLAPLGYDVDDKKLIVNEREAESVSHIFRCYLELGSVRRLRAELDGEGHRSKIRKSAKGNVTGGKPFSRGALYTILRSRLYLGEITHRDQSYPGEHDAIVDRELWERVNEQLARNRIERKNGTNATESSLLAGILFDSEEARLTPSHANKNGKRYRYYVTETLVNGEGRNNGSAMRLPASEVENAVLGETTRFLNSSSELLYALSTDADDVGCRQNLIERARELAATIVEGGNADTRQIVQSIVARVEIGKETLTILILETGLRQRLSGRVAGLETDKTIRLEAAFRLRRRGVEAKLILDGENNGKPPVIDHALIKAIARAHVWNRKLISGDKISIRQIANEVGVTHGYIRKILPLGFLDPDIVETILAGKQPRDLSLMTIIRDGVPNAWDEQRQRFGF